MLHHPKRHTEGEMVKERWLNGRQTAALVAFAFVGVLCAVALGLALF
jgi:hypothetical protein